MGLRMSISNQVGESNFSTVYPLGLKKNCLFPVRVGRAVKKIFCIISLVKNVCFMQV